MKKKINVLIFSLLLMIIPTINVDALGGELGGGGQVAGTCADKCSWVYDSDYKGLRLSLYKYEGTGNPTFVKSIELLNVPSKLNNKTISAATAHGRFGHTSTTFSSRNVGNRFQSLDTYGMTRIDSTNADWQKIKQNELKAYYGDTQAKRKQALRNMFGVTTDELAKYYIVLEPTIAIQNICGYGWAFGTGYEYMKNISTLNSSDYNCRGWNFGEAQGSTVRDYLFNGMYVALSKDGKYDTYNFVGPSGSGAYVIATSAATSKSDIENRYNESSFPYGIGIFWMLDGIKTCQSYCSGKTGDALLQCAENYCATKDENVTNSTKKRECIVNDCKYTPSTLSCGSGTKTNGTNTYCSATTSATKKTCSLKNLSGVTYKIECNSNTTIIYPDTLPKTILPGEGFEYQVRLYGNKTCTVKLDTGKWKLDYAASYTDTERANLVAAINSFNGIKFSDLYYSSDNAGIKIKIKEKYNVNKNKEETKDLIAQEKYNLGSEDVTQTNTSSTIKSYYTEGETSKIKTVTVKLFTTDSSNEMLYDLPLVCISASDNITIKEGSSCENGLGPYNQYFTTIHAEKGTNDTKTTALHNPSGLDVVNTCEYTVTPDELSCNISVNNQCSNYFNATGDVVFKLEASYNRNRTKTIKYHMATTTLDSPDDIYNNKQTYTVSHSTITEPKEITIYGTVTDGTNVKHCSKTVTVYPNNNKCEFVKTENVSAGTVTISIKEIANSNAVYQIKASTSNKWMDIRSKTIKNDENIILEGRILVDGEVIRDCFYEYPPKTTCPECTSLYMPSEYAKIKEHCTNYWQIDRAGYTSYDNCYTDCTNGSGQTCKKTCDTKDLSCVRNYCKDNFGNDGYPTYGDCVNDCSDPNDGLNYYYRTISNDNPFPQREAHYNWIGYEEYITNDTHDSTPSIGGSYPEYEIKLDKDRMKKINENTYNYNSNSNNTAYSDYIRVNSTDTGKYKSKFIHEDDPAEGGFKSYFTYIEGSMVGG